MLELKQARILMLQVVNDQGHDFKYCLNSVGYSCYYVPLSKVEEWADHGLLMHSTIGPSSNYDPRRFTGCLIGRVLEAAGETRHLTPTGLGKNVHELRAEWPDMMSPETAEYLQAAQVIQDRGGTWGSAFSAAEEFVRRTWPHLAAL